MFCDGGLSVAMDQEKTPEPVKAAEDEGRVRRRSTNLQPRGNGAFLLEQRQHALRDLVGLSHHGGSSLLQDLGAGKIGRFCGKVGVLNA